MITITLQQLYIYYNIHTVFKLGSVIYSNILKAVSSAQKGCIYLYRKKIHAWFKKGSQKWPKNINFSYLLILRYIVLCWYNVW